MSRDNIRVSFSGCSFRRVVVTRNATGPCLGHRAHRARDDQGCIAADIDHDYAIVRDLMHDLLAVTAEVKIKDSIVETIDVVKTLTKNLALDEGTTAKAVGRLRWLQGFLGERILQGLGLPR